MRGQRVFRRVEMMGQGVFRRMEVRGCGQSRGEVRGSESILKEVKKRGKEQRERLSVFCCY